jgi:hypothetical protein
MMPAVGDSPLFISALKDLLLHAVGIDAGMPSVPAIGTAFHGSELNV